MNERSARILKSIEESGLSYSELSKSTGIPKSALQRYATGNTEKVPLDRLEAIAKATGVTAEYLICWDKEKTEEEKAISDLMDKVIDDTNLQNLITKYNGMNETSVKRLLKYADLLLEEEKEEEK